jgi:hypothetical protein
MAAELVDNPRFQWLKDDVEGLQLRGLSVPVRNVLSRGEPPTERVLTNGLSPKDNRFIETSRDYGRAISVLGAGLQVVRAQKRP